MKNTFPRPRNDTLEEKQTKPSPQTEPRPLTIRVTKLMATCILRYVRHSCNFLLSYVQQKKTKKSRRRDRRKTDNVAKIQTEARHAAQKVISAADMTNPHATKTGWSGQDYKRRPDAEKIQQQWLDRTIVHIMINDYGFERVAYDK